MDTRVPTKNYTHNRQTQAQTYLHTLQYIYARARTYEAEKYTILTQEYARYGARQEQQHTNENVT